MTKTATKTKVLSLFLAVLMLVGMLPMSAFAATVGDGSTSCTVSMTERNYFLRTTAGTTLGASSYQYTTNDGLTGPAYCINHGLNLTSRSLPIAGEYTASVATAAAFATAYPQHSLETFLGRYPNDSLLVGLTEKEYAYATQLAIWATLGQLSVEGTSFTSGRESVAQPIGDAQQMRIFHVIQLILGVAQTWDRIYQTGMYIRLEEDALGGNISIPADMTLEYAADRESYGIKREVINGRSYTPVSISLLPLPRPITLATTLRFGPTTLRKVRSSRIPITMYFLVVTPKTEIRGLFLLRTTTPP